MVCLMFPCLRRSRRPSRSTGSTCGRRSARAAPRPAPSSSSTSTRARWRGQRPLRAAAHSGHVRHRTASHPPVRPEGILLQLPLELSLELFTTVSAGASRWIGPLLAVFGCFGCQPTDHDPDRLALDHDFLQRQVGRKHCHWHWHSRRLRHGHGCCGRKPVGSGWRYTPFVVHKFINLDLSYMTIDQQQ